MSLIERIFHLKERGTTVGREVRGGAATFLTMAYILVANPAILSAAGVPTGAAIAGTAAAAAVASLLMGVFANVPIALAPGMGLNAIIAFQIAPQLGSWQAAMGLVVLDGLVVLLFVLVGVREAVLNAVPRDLRRAIGVGIGLFIAFIGLVNARIVVVPGGTVAGLTANPTAVLPPVTFGSLATPEAITALVGVTIVAALLARNVNGAILLGIAASTAVAVALGITGPPPAVVSQPDFSTLFQADISSALTLVAMPLLASIIMVDFFDTMGTASAIAEEAGIVDENENIPRMRTLLAMDAVGASIGGLFGVSSATSYIESAAGVAEGARTGLHSVVVAILFALALFIAPLLGIVPASATAPALIVVGFLMCQQIGRIDFRTIDTALPAFVLLVTIPFTYSISHGIGYGFITYVAIKFLTLRARDVHPLMLVTAIAFAAYFVYA